MSRKRPSAATAAAEPTTAAPGTEAQTIIQDATQATQPESTLGDGDATGAAQEATPATAAPEAPTPDVVKPAAEVQRHAVRVIGPAKGRWRAGRKFGPEPVDIPVADLSGEDFEKLEADPELTVVLVPIEA